MGKLAKCACSKLRRHHLPVAAAGAERRGPGLGGETPGKGGSLKGMEGELNGSPGRGNLKTGP